MLRSLIGAPLLLLAGCATTGSVSDPQASRVDSCLALLGYREDAVLAGPVVTRESHAVGRVVIAGEQFAVDVAPSAERFCDALPETAVLLRTACPGLLDHVLRLFEAGALYEGPAEGTNEHPHARGRRFWSKPRILTRMSSDGPVYREDPVDSLVWFLIEGYNALAADSFQATWNRVLYGTATEAEYVRTEARLKAQHLARALRTLRRYEDCLDLDTRLIDSGAVFAEYERWFRQAGESVDALAEIILDNPARYVDNPAESSLTYLARLRELYRKNVATRSSRSSGSR